MTYNINIVSKLGIISSQKIPKTHITKTQLISQPRDSIKRKNHNKSTMNYSKENTDFKPL